MVSSIPNRSNLIPLVFNSKGDKKLTDEEKNELSKEFDVTDMTSHDEMRLLGKLTEYGVVSSDDFFHSFLESTSTLVSFDSTKSVSEREAYSQAAHQAYMTQTRNWLSYYAKASQSTKDCSETAFDARLGGIFSELV